MNKELFIEAIEAIQKQVKQDIEVSKHLLLGTVVSFPNDNEMIMFKDFRWWKGIPSKVDFKIESIANKSVDEFWLVADGYGSLSKPNCYGNGKIAVELKYIIEALSLQ